MRIAFVSDTHGERPKIPDADLLIHCGDICPRGGKTDFLVQLAWLFSLRSDFPKGIILSPGNHDIIVQEDTEWARSTCDQLKLKLLIDEAIEIDGVKIYCSPWTPTFYDWAYMGSEEELKVKWDSIPENTQVLVTHGPAKYILDYCQNGNVGSQTLGIKTCFLEKLKVHAFGHIHESYGARRVDEKFWALNASIVTTFGFYGMNDPHVIDTETWDLVSDTLPLSQVERLFSRE